MNKLKKSTLFMSFGLLIILIISIFTYIKENEVTVETIELDSSSQEINEIINTRGKDFEFLTFTNEGWTYLYFQIPLGYYSIDINVTEKKNHYLAQAIVRYADNDQYVETENLVRFKPRNNKTLKLKQVIEVPELKIKN